MEESGGSISTDLKCITKESEGIEEPSDILISSNMKEGKRPQQQSSAKGKASKKQKKQPQPAQHATKRDDIDDIFGGF